MKKIITLALIVIVTGCAKQRTTPYYSTQGMAGGVPGKPIVSVLTNSDYDQQQLDKKKESLIKPQDLPNKIVPLTDGFSQADLSKLFESMNVEGVRLGMPEGVICEIIPQLRIQKTLGRLRCMKQTPETTNAYLLQNGTNFECSVNTSKGIRITADDAALYEGLGIAAIDETGNRVGASTEGKRIGSFYCIKVRTTYPGVAPRYNCGIESALN